MPPLSHARWQTGMFAPPEKNRGENGMGLGCCVVRFWVVIRLEYWVWFWGCGALEWAPSVHPLTGRFLDCDARVFEWDCDGRQGWRFD
jgi:hypothetical protein